VAADRLSVVVEAMPQTYSAFLWLTCFNIGYVWRSRVYVGEACLHPMVVCLCLWRGILPPCGQEIRVVGGG
jgi:hypothetical protein